MFRVFQPISETTHSFFYVRNRGYIFVVDPFPHLCGHKSERQDLIRYKRVIREYRTKSTNLSYRRSEVNGNLVNLYIPPLILKEIQNSRINISSLSRTFLIIRERLYYKRI